MAGGVRLPTLRCGWFRFGRLDPPQRAKARSGMA